VPVAAFRRHILSKGNSEDPAELYQIVYGKRSRCAVAAVGIVDGLGLPIATERESYSGTDLVHPVRFQLRDSSSDALPRDGEEVVQVHRTGSLHSVLLIEHDFGRNPANR
jgi:hypothetical protein